MLSNRYAVHLSQEKPTEGAMDARDFSLTWEKSRSAVSVDNATIAYDSVGHYQSSVKLHPTDLDDLRRSLTSNYVQ